MRTSRCATYFGERKIRTDKPSFVVILLTFDLKFDGEKRGKVF